jgi:glycosyltransferase involved in cell wall biosynthesis
VLFLIPTLSGGGAERVITTLLRHFDRSQFDLTLGVVDMRGAIFHADLPSDVALIDLASSRVRFALARIVQVVWSVRPDVVFSTLGHLNLALAMLRPFLPPSVRIMGRETVVVSEGLSEYRMPGFWKIIYKIFCKKLHHVICQSEDMRDDLAQNFHVPVEQITVIHNPVDLDSIKAQARSTVSGADSHMASPETVRLIAAGRLVPQKGFDLLIEAVAICRDPRIVVTILGQGPLDEELEALVKNLGLKNQVRLLGFQRNPYPFFAAADAFVLSSRYEGFPNVALEALACGTPIIATPAPGGTRELLESIQSCELAEAVSASALANAIHRWIARRPPRVDHAVVQPFAVHKIVTAYERQILRVASTG